MNKIEGYHLAQECYAEETNLNAAAGHLREVDKTACFGNAEILGAQQGPLEAHNILCAAAAFGVTRLKHSDFQSIHPKRDFPQVDGISFREEQT